MEKKQLFQQWRYNSEQKLVCGMFGCLVIPQVKCTWGCKNYYCQEHSEEHFHSGANQGVSSKPTFSQIYDPDECWE